VMFILVHFDKYQELSTS